MKKFSFMLAALFMFCFLLPLSISSEVSAAPVGGFTVVNNGDNTFTVTREDTSAARTLYYRTVDESALAGVHYQAASGSLSFAAGEASKTVTVSETAVSSITDTVSRYQSADRTYRLEVYDSGTVLSAKRTLSYGASYNVSSYYYNGSVDSSGTGRNEYSTRLIGSEVEVTDDGYAQAVHTLSLDSFFSAAGAKEYFNATGTSLYTRLQFQAKEDKDGYQYVQILADNSTNADSGAGDGKPGTINYSLYMAGFSHYQDGKNTTYYSYAFPLKNAASNCGKISTAWNSDSYYNLGNTVGDMYQQLFKSSDNRSQDGSYLIVPITTSTLNYRFNASGNSGDDWRVKNSYVYLTLYDTTAPTVTAFTAPNGTYYRHSYVTFSVKFSEIVTVSDTPTITTDLGSFSYLGGSGTNALYFGGYITTATDSTASTISLTAISGSIKDLAGNALSASSLSLSSAFNIASAAPSGSGTQKSPYIIKSVEQLYWFQEMVNARADNMKTATYAKLGANITVNPGSFDASGNYTSAYGESPKSWEPICNSYDDSGRDEVDSYYGAFDGAGYKISGLYIADTTYMSAGGDFEYAVGFFGAVYSAQITDLTICDSCIYSEGDIGFNDVGMICGYVTSVSKNNSVTISNCASEDCIIRGYQNVGGITGNVKYATVSECVNTSTVISTGDRAGGISGYAVKQSKIENCINCGSVQGSSIVGGIVGELSGSLDSCVNYGTSGEIVGYLDDGTIERCVYLANEPADNDNGTYARISRQFASGEVTYFLNDGVTDGTQAWYQDIDNDNTPYDAYPVFSGEGATVYKAWGTTCAEYSYTNDETEAGTQPAHEFNDWGICTNCGCFQPAELNETDNVYEIENTGQLFWFAAKVNYGSNADIGTQDAAISGRLTKDIDLDDLSAFGWTPIGSTDYPYTGSFDGQGYSVKLNVTTSGADYTGLFGVVGGGVSISNVIVKGTVQNMNGADYIAGLVAGSNGSGTVTITGCGNEAAVTGSGANAAGIFGVNMSSAATVKITDCYNTGSISGNKESAAISGWLGNNAVVADCYNTGSVSGCDSGKTFARFNSATFTNCYQLDTIEAQSNITSKTQSAFSSGEVAYLLNDAAYDGTQIWYQTLDTDGSPKFSGKTVYPTYSDCTCTVISAYNNTGVSTPDHVDTNPADNKCDICGTLLDGKTAKLYGYTLSLEGNIGVNFYVQLSAEAAADTSAVMNFTLPCDKSSSVTVGEVINAEKTETISGTTYYIFSCEVAAKEMTGEIKAQITFSDGTKSTEYTYSVRDYADYILSHTEAEEYAAAADLIKAMLNYGAYAQINFAYNTYNLANSGYEQSLDRVNADDLTDFAYRSSGSSANVSFYGSNLVLLSETTLKLYFNVADDADVSFTLDDVKVEPTHISGNIYYVAITDIASSKLGENHTVSVDGLTLDCSALGYAYAALTSTNERIAADTALHDAVKALYLYQQAAASYFGNGSGGE